MSRPFEPSDAEPRVRAEHVLRVRSGHGANCSSIGSVVDALFATATVGAALFAAVVAALGSEPVTVVGTAGDGDAPEPEGGPPEARRS